MSNWDEDSPRLRQNLQHVLQQIAQGAESRTTPITEWARRWQFLIMRGLDVPNVRHVGKFRGESGLENLQVTVGGNHGAPPARVAEELKRFEATLQTLVAELDEVLPIGHELHADQLAAVLDLVHGPTPSGYASILSPTGTDVLRGSGPITSPCATGCRLLSVCVQDPTQTMRTQEKGRCAASGNPPQMPSAGCFKIFLTNSRNCNSWMVPTSGCRTQIA